jgi:hypothetical protein
MNELKKELKERTERALHDMISRDTGKDVGDFGGEFGLLEWLVAEGFQDHAKLLIDNSDNDLTVILL